VYVVYKIHFTLTFLILFISFSAFLGLSQLRLIEDSASLYYQILCNYTIFEGLEPVRLELQAPLLQFNRQKTQSIILHNRRGSYRQP